MRVGQCRGTGPGDDCVLIEPPENCTGCMACAAACDNGAITCGENSEGFYRPRLDLGRCSHCGRCAKVCHLCSDVAGHEPDAAFAAQSLDDELLLPATSGGAFQALARHVVEGGGYVCGCVWGDGMRAEHVMSRDVRDIGRMAGSKYVQSFISPDLYPDVATALDEGGKVLFAGMPCQVAAMRSYLGEREGLVTVDFPCYGVPSPTFFREQVLDIERRMRAKVADFRFRDKQKNGFSHTTVVKLEGKRGPRFVTIDDYREVPYHHAFGKCDCFDEPCYRCGYNRAERVADITLGSFWGIEDVDPSFDVEAGVSMVLTNTPRGARLWESVLPGFSASRQGVDVAIAHNEGIVKGKERPPARSEVYRCLKSEGFTAVARRFYRFSFARRVYNKSGMLKRLGSLFR